MQEKSPKNKQCLPCEGGVKPLKQVHIARCLGKLKGWSIVGDKTIVRLYKFDNYYKVIAFVNAVAFLSHMENHHPELNVSYNFCKVSYTTHAIDGLSENDFICAKKVNDLIDD